MNEKTERIKELEKLIIRYQKSYYTGIAEIEDFEFDKLWDELKALDADNPILKKIGSDVFDQYDDGQNLGQTGTSAATGTSVATGTSAETGTSVATSDGGNFEKRQHLIPMGSQEKAANPEEFLNWAIKHNYDEYLVEYKLDGASLELQYENGVFVRGVTRGNGVVGDDITANVLKMQGLVKELTEKSDETSEMTLFGPEILPFTGGIRGEVIMSHEVHDKHFFDKANCRNAANGLMKRKDGSGSENLQIICYDAWFTDTGGQKSPFSTEIEKMEWLSKMGFQTSPLVICKNAQEVIDYRAKVMEIRKEIPYDIDGLVIKPKKIDYEDASRNRPDKQIAFKFSLEEAVSIVRQVEWSESGATYTPIAIFDAVELAGTTVKRASLVNPNTIRDLGVQIGSHVVVVKRGEIIPKIERLVSDENAVSKTPIFFPQKCSVCGSELQDDGTRLYCPNKLCSKRVHHRIEKWISVLDIRDFGETLIKKLFDSGRIKSISDIYTLTEDDLTKIFLNEESLANEKESLGAKKVLNAIKAKTEIPLATFIAGFDIEGVGEVQAEKIVDNGFDSLEKIISCSENDIASVPGFAEISSHTFCQGIAENADEMFSLVKNGTIRIKAKSQGVFSGMSFCFTGELHTMKRQDAENLVKSLGGSAKSSVVKDLTYLVTNDTSSGSSKNRKAQELGISIINEETFLSLAKGQR
mgnify:CR=1 FL=1